MLKYGSISATRNISYDGQLFQHSKKENVIVAGTPNTVAIDFDNGNFQYIDLSTSTNDIQINVTNQKIGVYSIVVKQHATYRRDITFAGAYTYYSSVRFTDVPLTSELPVCIICDGNKCYVFSEQLQIQLFTIQTKHAAGSLVLHDVGSGLAIYSANIQHERDVAFIPADWTCVGAANSAYITYSDPYATGNNTVESALSYLISSPKFIANEYATIDTLLADNAEHVTNRAYLVSDVSAGSMIDSRIHSGYAIYVKTSTTTGSINNYRILTAEMLESDQLHFDNSFARLIGNPENVRTAIEALKSEINDLLNGLKFIDLWDSVTNTPVLGNNGKYNDGTGNTPVLSVNELTSKITCSTAGLGTVVATDYVKIADITYRITNRTDLAGTTTLTIVNALTSANLLATDITVGDMIYTANKLATSGEYFLVNNIGSEMTPIDGATSYTINDRLLSNGLVWKHAINANVATATEIFYDKTGVDWGSNNPINVQEAIDVLRTEQNISANVLDKTILITSASIIDSDILAISTTGKFTTYTLYHGMNALVHRLQINLFINDTLVSTDFYATIPNFVKTTSRSGGNILNEFDIQFLTPTATENVRININLAY
jgi:hypothetical protein